VTLNTDEERETSEAIDKNHDEELSQIENIQALRSKPGKDKASTSTPSFPASGAFQIELAQMHILEKEQLKAENKLQQRKVEELQFCSRVQQKKIEELELNALASSSLFEVQRPMLENSVCVCVYPHAKFLLSINIYTHYIYMC